jgi:hypothetical protein
MCSSPNGKHLNKIFTIPLCPEDKKVTLIFNKYFCCTVFESVASSEYLVNGGSWNGDLVTVIQYDMTRFTEEVEIIPTQNDFTRKLLPRYNPDTESIKFNFRW